MTDQWNDRIIRGGALGSFVPQGTGWDGVGVRPLPVPGLRPGATQGTCSRPTRSYEAMPSTQLLSFVVRMRPSVSEGPRTAIDSP